MIKAIIPKRKGLFETKTGSPNGGGASVFSEVAAVELVQSTEKLNSSAYLACNPDVAAAGVSALDHFTLYGIHEARRQLCNLEAIADVRVEKLRRISFRTAPQIKTAAGQLNFLSQVVKTEMGIPDAPPIVENDYPQEIIELIRANPDKLFLDVGAGLRHTYYSNVVNVEIWPSMTADVISIGENLPFSDGQFDFVFCLAVLEHTKRPWLAAKELIRVAKPNGTLRVDWPFLQPVHGYPHHFFNATPAGHASLFEDECEILSCEVRLWQHPIFALSWMLNEWRDGLPEAERKAFEEVRVGDLLGLGKKHLWEPFCSELSTAAQKTIAAGTTVVAKKRPKASTPFGSKPNP